MMFSENVQYSDSEKKVFTKLGYSNLLDYVQPVVLYRMAIEICFLDNLSGPVVDALRRGGNALLRNRPNIYRMTEEFNKLVEF
jgi:hypothetical protein